MNKDGDNPAVRPFPWKCGYCREREVYLERVPYSVEIAHGGRTYTVTVPDLEVPRCRKCQTLVLHDAANRRITEAFRRQAGLLTPEEVRQGREALGLTTAELAGRLGVEGDLLSSVEAGLQAQPFLLDRFLRVFFAFDNVRATLAAQAGANSAGAPPVPVTTPQEPARR
jgi:DNA-binding transcriptional regulator YiaG